MNCFIKPGPVYKSRASFISSSVVDIAVLNSPVDVGLLSSSGHEDIDFTTWHEVLLWHGQVLVHNPVVSLWVVGSNLLSNGVGLLIEPPLVSSTSELSITVIIVEEFVGSEVLELSVASPDPLLRFVSSLLVVNDGLSLLLGQDHVVSGGISLLKMEPHALVWLHGGGSWLLEVLSPDWGSVAVNNFNIEIDI